MTLASQHMKRALRGLPPEKQEMEVEGLLAGSLGVASQYPHQVWYLLEFTALQDRLEIIGAKKLVEEIMATEMSDPFAFAEGLIRDNGLKQAIQMTNDDINRALQDGDNFARDDFLELKAILQGKKESK